MAFTKLQSQRSLTFIGAEMKHDGKAPNKSFAKAAAQPRKVRLSHVS